METAGQRLRVLRQKKGLLLNVTYSAEENPEDAEFWTTYKKLTEEQKKEILEFMKFRLSQN